MSQEITKITELVIDVDNIDESLLERFGVDVISIVDSPAIGVNFYAFEEFINPSVGEDKDTFLNRCMGDAKMVSEYPDSEQRFAVCNSYYQFESYSDYPEAASNNAKRAIKYAEENGWGDCGTQVGKVRASQLANKEALSVDTISRMASFERHRQHKDVPYDEGCGGLMWDAWGGDAGIEWASRKLKEIQENSIVEFYKENGVEITNRDFIIDLSVKEFSGVSDVLEAIQSLSVLSAIDDDGEEYFKYENKLFSKEEVANVSSDAFKRVKVFNKGDNRVIIIPKESKPKVWEFSLNEEERIIVGPVMIPNKMMLRKDKQTGEFYHVYCSRSTIKKMSEKFFKLNKHNNTDVQHDWEVTTDNTLLESWISESTYHDKAYTYGFALPAGTWYVSYRINNDDTWEKIKRKELNGLSLAGPFIEKDNDEQILNKVKSIIRNVKQ